MIWAPGQSGNPAGRPKGTGHLQRLRRHRGEFVQALRDGLKDPDPRLRATCIELGLAYCYGKPGAAPPADDALPLYSRERMTPDERREAEAMMEKPPLKQ
jgi:hypothetical protein